MENQGGNAENGGGNAWNPGNQGRSAGNQDDSLWESSCLLLRLKSWSARGAFHHPALMSHTLFALSTKWMSFPSRTWGRGFFSPSPANICLDEDVLKTTWRRLEDVFSVTFFCLPRRLEGVLKTSWRRLPRRLQDVLGRRIASTSWRRLEDVLEDEKCYVEDVVENNVCWSNLYSN